MHRNQPSPALGPWIDHTVALVRAFTDEVLDGRPDSYVEAATWIGLASEAVWRRWRDGSAFAPAWALLEVEDFALMVAKRPGFDPWRRARAFGCLLMVVPWLCERGELSTGRAGELVNELRPLLEAERPRPCGRAPAIATRGARVVCRRPRRRMRTLPARLGRWGPPPSALRPAEALR